MTNNDLHEPVLIKEVLEALEPISNEDKELMAIDATLGTGGHSQALLNQGYQVLAIEADKDMLAIAKSHLTGDIKFANGNFKDLDHIVRDADIKNVDAILFDLGVSNLQLTSEDRGFSFIGGEAPLDMRIDREGQSLTAADLLNVLRKDQLEFLFAKVLKPWEAKKIVAEILNARETTKFATVADFLAVCSVVRTKPGLNRATLPLLALRIAVNSELENLIEVLPKALEIVKSGGRILVIYFHSLERQIISKFVHENKDKLIQINAEPISAGFEEVQINPKSRSARLVILEKI